MDEAAAPIAASAPEHAESEPATEDAAQDEEDAEPEAPRTTFADLGLSDELLRAVTESGYIHPTPIQEQAIPIVLMGRDVMGCAQTGTGKTASFTLPMMDILSGSRAKARMPRSLILEPTRELALQVAEQFVKYGKYLNLNHALLIGGESMNDQRDVLEKGVDVLIATPGRLLDLFDRGRILMADCKLLVIDEADRMLDMGFIPDVERIVGMLPPLRQTLFFSATMAPEIRRLADAFLRNPKEITVSRPASVATTITTGVLYVQERDKREALRRLIRREQVQNALIFCNRKIEVDVLYKSLKRHGFSVGALHGDMDQSARFATLNAFKANEIRLLVCSDVAARGLDIGGLSHVFNFDVPFHSEDYVHRIGRTGRAGREGHAYTIATADDGKLVQAIEKLTGGVIPRMEVEGLDLVTEAEIAEAATRRRGRGGARPGGKPEPARAGRGGRDRGETRGRGPREDRPRTDSAEAAPSVAEPREAAPREDRPRRDDRPRGRDRGEAAPPREARPPRDEARRDEARRDEAPRPRRDEAPRPRDREDAPRARDRDDSPRARDRDDSPRARDRDDMGPSVRGFGDSIPAFMLIPIPRPKRPVAEAPVAEAIVADSPAEFVGEPVQDADAAA
ncbi:DEAD/DEAH box helicase [Sediminicoccus sp. KRV36]|uniref:DEAD/DEAH box helicase n=1 Tax=Sediminicoccus sp. KRV36 TaxID=3133721 RepID=UPI00200F2624|nr:DEAD/DEAH box helicase [Sediminicoccus rosea]UPY39392.1 DEAD/DEAH box helicase [Sediminicoccus rosea]